MMEEPNSENARLILGDCMDAMRGMADNTFDSIVCDPPYGIAFMGSKWDNFGMNCGNDSAEVRREKASDYSAKNKGAPRYFNSHGTVTRKAMVNFQAAMTPIFEEALRVAKPGAFLCAFGGTRTYHRLACAIEDAGWEILDCVMFVHGCLSEDSEILTKKGWKGIGEINEGEELISYNRDDKAFHVERCERTFLYDYKDTAYRIQSDTTDQLLSKNHRVLVERGGVEVFEYAENLAQEREVCVPILASVQEMLDNLSGIQPDASKEESVLLQKMPSTQGQKSFCAELQVQGMRKGVLQTEKHNSERGRSDVLKTLQQRSEGQGLGKIQQSTPASNHRRAEVFDANSVDRLAQSFLEGGSCSCKCHKTKTASEVGQMPDEISKDGKAGRMGDGSSANSSESTGASLGTQGGRTPLRWESCEQYLEESSIVSEQCRPQKIRATWKPTTTLARITSVWYEGHMWCVSVHSGAIVARRNGKIFITGNSGFPKGLDISKSIDKKLGAKREVVGTATNGAGANLVKIQNHGPGDTGIGKWDGSGKVYDITAPATEEAKKWEGFNTQIKPAVEPIVIARKPVECSVTENVMKWGTGAFNIDACRIPTTEPITIHSPARKTLYDSGHADLGTWQQTKGRWPANFVHDGSDEVLALLPNTGKSSGGGMHTKGIGGNQSGICLGKYSNGKATEKVGFGDAGSAARFFYCAKPSRKDRGEGNTHPTVKALSLMRWLVRLVTRKGGLVLDPFMGSGTTGVACAVEGMRFVGCEKEPAYFEIAKRRIGGTGFGMEVDGDDDEEDGTEATTSVERQSASTSQPSKPGLVQGELFG